MIIERVVVDKNVGNHILELIVPSESGGMQSEYISYNTAKKINNLIISFNSNLDSDFSINLEDSFVLFSSKI